MKNVKSVLSLFCSRLRPVGGGLFLCIVIFFTSCENFMNGAELKKKIEDQVTLANAPEYQIVIDGNKGKFSPSKGSYPLKVTQSMNISFESDTDFAFIRWEVFNALTGKTLESSEYIDIADPGSDETSIKLLKSPASGVSLGVRSIVRARPQIISYTPSALGMLKDSSIQVLFNRDMDPDSIYYSKPERDELKITEGLGDNDFLDTTIGGEKKYYGYTKDKKKFFKNIMLSNNKTGENINDRFGIPVFESPRTLSISTSKEDGHILDDYTQVLVELEKGFFYTEQKKPVEMAGSKMWMYQVNDRTDTKPLVVTKSGGNDRFFVKVDEETQLVKSASFAPTQSGFESLRFTADGNLAVDIHVQEQDGGSGPNSFFTVNVKKLYGENYADLEQPIEKSFTVDFQNVTSGEGVFKGSVDLKKEGVPLGDGVYEMNFEFKDRSNNSMTYPSGGNFYFAVDTKAPEINMPTVSSDNSTTYTLSWSDYIDLKTAEILYKEDDTEKPAVLVAKGIQSGNITDIAAGKIYDVKVKFTDFAGNYTEKTIPKFLTGYYTEGTLDFNKENASHAAKVFFAGDKLSDYGVNSIKIAWSDGTVEDVISSGYIIPNGPNNNSVFNSDWKLFYKNEGEIYKYAAAPGSYYIAKKDSLTQVPVALSNGNYQFGDYPQNVSSISSYTTNPVYNGWYIGSDGYFYEKCTTWVATQEGNGNMMSNGQRMANNTQYYFRVQPIEWQVLTNSYNGGKLLWPRKNLDRCVYYSSTSNRTINGSTIYPNIYKYSALRAFLNGKYESGDPQSKTYLNNGFLQRAFTSSAQSSLLAAGPENDKVFVLSKGEATNSSYGFKSDPTWAHFGLRLVRTTDYAKAKHVFQSRWADGKYESNWWLRSPDSNSSKANFVSGEAVITTTEVTSDIIGVVPVIVLLNGF